MDYIDSMPAGTLLTIALSGLTAVNLALALFVRSCLVGRIIKLLREGRAIRKRLARLEQSNCAAFDELEKHHGRMLCLELRDHVEIDFRTYGGRNN